MNSLNLRIATVKTGENIKKNAEMRTSLAALPKHYESSENCYCVEFKNAKTIPEQVSAVKGLFKSLGSDVESLQIFADLYFYCPPKHPVRNQILKLLITAARVGTGSIDDASIVQALSHAELRLVEETRTHTESSQWNAAIASLAGCFDNFDSGLKAFEQNVVTVFSFLCAAVQKYLKELGVLSSPSVCNEYYLYIHNAIRLMLSCVQEFSAKVKQSHTDQLRQLQVVCREIILDDEIPMDPRTNSGILLAQIAKLFGEYESFIQEVKLTKNPNEIAICVGVVNTFTQHDFQEISADIRDVCSKIEEIANAHANVPNILLCGARALYQISRVLLHFDLKLPEIADDAKLILRKLLIFAFGYLEHHMDSVRHICRDLLRNIVAAAEKIQFDFLLQKIYDACNSERLCLSMKCVVLQQAALILGAEKIIKNCPQLFTHLFAEYLGQDFIVNNLFEALMSANHKEVDYDAWFQLWIKYLLDIASANNARLPDIENLIVKAVKCEPKIVQHIIEQTDMPIPISTKLSALWAVRKTGIKMDNFNEIMEKFSKYLLLSILSNCDETRIMALRLLVETHKTTELLTPLECQHLLTYLEYNANCQSPATRQKTLSLLGKALMRCELNLVKVLKDFKPTPGAAKPMHLRFLLDFMHILVSNLFQGANFSRRSISLQLLEQCLHICLNCNLNLVEVLPPNTINALADVLADTYEANKQLAVNILRLIEDKLTYSLIQHYNIAISMDLIQEQLTSVRPLDSVTASYQLEFYCNHKPTLGNYETTSYSPTYYAALRWLLGELKAGLQLAKQSILQAAKLNPLYGILFAVKHLVKLLDFPALAQDIAWRIVIAELIVLCKELTTVVAPVVNSSSPEGHLPNDFSSFPAEYAQCEEPSDKLQQCKILSSKNGKLDLANLKTTPQMVLLCAWRTVKEVSLILGEIVLHSPIEYSKMTEQFLVTKEQILEIGEHFKQLLAETKHRGAFEQAYVGFSKLVVRLWRVEAPDLNSLPMQWLRDLIALISKDEQINDKICATRRSAGVPFMVQALITAELQVGTSRSLYYSMSHLLQLCASAERSSESRTHALNILRALFRCTDLSEPVGEFASDGVMCAIRGYEADNWSEKNSATLLFAALITRIFGVQRTKDADNLNIRNKMTGRVFFLRYPKLYDFFLEQLQAASALILQQQKAHKLHPMLLILSRLYPSALEGTESNLKLTAFLPYISNCAGCADMQTRYLAAKAVVALITKDAAPSAVLGKCAEITIAADEAKRSNLNVLHGQLLQILLLLRANKTFDAVLISDLSWTLVAAQQKMQIKNAVVLKVILDIFIEILNSLSNLTYQQSTVQNLIYFSTQKQFETAELSHFYAVLRKSLYIYNLHILRLTLPFGALSDYLLSPPLTHDTVSLEQAETRLNVILLILLSQHEGTLTAELTEFEFTAAELQFVRMLDESTHNELAAELRQSKSLQLTLKELTTMPLYFPACTIKAYAILSLLDHFDFNLTHLIKETKKQPGDVKTALTICVERLLLLKQDVDLKTAQLCLEYLCEITQPWQPDCLRLQATQILTRIAAHYTKALEKKKVAFVRLYISLILALLMDEEFDVRNNAAKIVLSNLTDDIEMETVVATMAQRLFLQSTADILLRIKADDDYVLEIFKIITETLTSANWAEDSSAAGSQNNNNNSNASSPVSSITSDLEIFDKSDANVFAEPEKAISDSIVVFKNTFSKRSKVLKYVNDYKV